MYFYLNKEILKTIEILYIGQIQQSKLIDEKITQKETELIQNNEIIENIDIIKKLY